MGFSDLIGLANRVTRDVVGGDPVSYVPSEGDQVELTGIFDDPFLHVDVGTAGVTGSGPVAFLLLEDLDGNDPEEDSEATLIHNDVTYSIREVQKDGQGGVRLLLHKV